MIPADWQGILILVYLLIGFLIGLGSARACIERACYRFPRYHPLALLLRMCACFLVNVPLATILWPIIPLFSRDK